MSKTQTQIILQPGDTANITVNRKDSPIDFTVIYLKDNTIITIEREQEDEQ